MRYCTCRTVLLHLSYCAGATIPSPSLDLLAKVSQNTVEGTTMSNARTQVASHRYAGSSVTRPSFRAHLKPGVAAASVGVLALSLVAAPSDADEARTKLRAVQLVAFAPSSTALSTAIVEEYVRQQAAPSCRVTPVVVVAEGTAEVATVAKISSMTAMCWWSSTGTR